MSATSAQTATPTPSSPSSSEELRVAALRMLNVMDRPSDPGLEGLARLAAYICGTPTAVVNLIDADRQHSAAAYGFAPVDQRREDSMCAVAVDSKEISYTPDASIDPRWARNPFVTGVIDEVRTYAAAPLILPGGEVIGTMCAFSKEVSYLSRVQLERLRDVAELTVKMLQLRDETSRLGHAATRDQLTGLPNRSLLLESLDQALARASRGEAQPSLVFLDLDEFKVVNDTYGHSVGDELLRAVADRLLQCVRASDLVARLAGDEFIVLCSGSSTGGLHWRIDGLLDRLRAAFTRPFPLSVGNVRVGASLGLAYAGRDGDDAASLIAHADFAMYADKRIRAGR
ncbi:sensor domain-containing diguanylate cyclase [Jatrophihabitans telluris]|uniref:Sensor domain-containing diguanylate cyclase n=1 Tax=Jatrophihabitans telluris TaxID=2038343 RepID=A0ABY4QXV0_9ACTN|nr:sensor domain-containing diguanylate cyclase [Jatrophihabitans telluris]UQX88340.1 sensor domain-containing diguanylate cyclase [Jatrophihabitans telluris]